MVNQIGLAAVSNPRLNSHVRPSNGIPNSHPAHGLECRTGPLELLPPSHRCLISLPTTPGHMVPCLPHISRSLLRRSSSRITGLHSPVLGQERPTKQFLPQGLLPEKFLPRLAFRYSIHGPVPEGVSNRRSTDLRPRPDTRSSIV
ncbi:hypothetical protein BDV27DRAFT_139492 [Aspergillus caelatus]|uniref:Uncharacterized protein n=1 Tax=Aspergillus caelatus TaxID=61420 RepID=A0A5N6ZI68_9EURO|nr:uncharacterized protein BDV27DRAFT_139492 [Aspergillus caelatus]KAE8357354.1 hypothetical protein BDV27DRAFT_139492 [Aspergillus caelatus]